jgi:hypothetical protein
VVQRKFLITARLFFGLLTLVAIGDELVIDIQGGHSLVNFFSFFTNLSNIFAAIVLIIGAIHLIKRRQPTVAEDIIRGSSVACMALVGIVFGALLRDVDLGDLLPWVNTILHYIMPGCRGSRLALPAAKVEAFSQAVMALAHFSITLLGLLVDPWRSH